MLETFERAYRSGVPFAEDRILGPELVHEVAPVLETLARALSTDENAGCHEAYALLTLLGRRAGVLGATPTAALVVLRAMVTALEDAAIAPGPSLRDELTMVLLEGYSAGRDERMSADFRARLMRSQCSLRLAPHCCYFAPSGPLDPEALEHVFEEAAREFLREDGRACLLDLARLVAPSREDTARPVLEFCLQCRAVGGVVFLTGATAELSQELRALGLSDEVAEIVGDFAAAMTRVLAACGLELRARRGNWTKALFARR